MKGRKPKPTAIKVLEGNPGRRPLNRNEPQPVSDKPSCPPHLTGEARKEWNRISKELHAAGLLTRIDRTALGLYCQAFQRWLEAEAKLKQHGFIFVTKSKYPVLSPYLSVANTAMAQIQKSLIEFGMTPSSRSRISIADTSVDDELEEFLS